MLQKQLAKSMVEMQAEADVWCWRKRVPISSRVGRRNLGGGKGQLALSARMLIMRAALVELLGLRKTSAFGRPGWIATRPADRRASSMAWTHGQLEGFCGGVRASARSRPPGAEESQMC